MPTDKTPRDDDETLALPLTGAAADDSPAVPQETVVLPETPSQAAETTSLPVDETRPLPVTETESPAPAPAYTSPIGAFYTPPERADRPEPVDAVGPAPVEPDPVDPHRRRLRVGTVVWGLVIAAIGVGLLAWAAGLAIDLQLAMIVLLAVAGTALLVGSILSGARNARR